MAAAQAALTFDANLDPFQEVPPNNTPGFGSGDFSLNGTTLSVTAGSYSDLLGNSTLITVNDAAVGVNGPRLFALVLDSPGTLSGTFSGSGTLTAGQITDLEAGNLYVNLQDSVFPSGEIRGQILSTAVPEASTIIGGALLLLPLAASGLRGLRNRKVSRLLAIA